MVIQRVTTCVCCLTLILIAGCGAADKSAAKRPKTFPSSGSVKLNGQPVTGATVVFAPDPGGTPTSVAALAMTDSDGNFSLQAYPPLKGAVPGKYKVTVTKVEPPPSAPTGPNAHEAPPPPPPKALIPEKFADVASSGLIAEIPDGGRDDLHFDLK
ncbi:MAG: carboxypeptidase-like regulatory domain-containing protein [Planctomycetota bacterium]